MNKINLIMTFAFLSINSGLSLSKANNSSKIDEPTTLEVLKSHLGTFQFDDAFLSTIAQGCDDLTHTTALGKVKISNQLFIESEFNRIKRDVNILSDANILKRILAALIQKGVNPSLIKNIAALGSELNKTNISKHFALVDKLRGSTERIQIFCVAASISEMKKEFDSKFQPVLDLLKSSETQS